MHSIQRTIEVDAPISKVYNQWTQFEDFPRFMEGVEQVKQIDDRHLHWVANMAGKTKEWDAEIVEQQPDRRIAWRSTSGARNSGVVCFRPKDQTHTEVSLELFYEPETFVEKAADAVGVLSKKVEGDLERFRDFIQARGSETGAWRGEIHGRQVQRGDGDPGKARKAQKAQGEGITIAPEYDNSGESGLRR